MNVQVIDLHSRHLEAVKELGKANAATLGFFPDGAFDDHANHRRILVALDEKENCLGYLLYRVSRNQAIIVHLCVEQSNRRKGVARELIKHLQMVTPCLHGIGLRCRRDYEASKVWPRFNFIARFEQSGRGKDQKELTFWWLDSGHPTLFTEPTIEKLASKLCVVVDANVFFDLIDNKRPGYEESSSLLADWLSETIEVCLTEEIYNEVNRNPDKDGRHYARQRTREFLIPQCDSQIQSTVIEELAVFFPTNMSARDESDLRQLARTIASEIKFFVTRDEPLLSLAERIYKKYGVTIIRPADLIIRLDELQREDEYQPARLAGTLTEVQRVQSGQEDLLVDYFQSASQGESRPAFKQQLRRFLANPLRYDCKIIFNVEKKPMVLFVYDRGNPNEIVVPIFRLGRSSLSATLAHHMAFRFIAEAAYNKFTFVRISDAYLDKKIISSLVVDKYIQVQDQWVKICLAVAEKAKELSDRLEGLNYSSERERQHFQSIISSVLKNESATTNAAFVSDIEHLLWPAKVVDAYIPTFIVPIQPKWAKDLFDEGLANQTLFGAIEELALSRESVYYRSRKNHGGLIAPGRILWYVSSKGAFEGAGQIRGCSRLDEVVIDKPKNLYRRFQRLGVYEWPQVFDLAKGDLNNEIMAFRFSDTELFASPISYKALQLMLRSKDIKSQLMSPLRIPPDLFTQIYLAGTQSQSKENPDA